MYRGLMIFNMKRKLRSKFIWNWNNPKKKKFVYTTEMVWRMINYAFYEFSKRFIRNSFKRVTKKVTHGSIKEFLWTVLPTVILIIIAIPSIQLLYSMDSIVLTGEPVYTFKVIGHQWFWSYEYFINPSEYFSTLESSDYNDELSLANIDLDLVNFTSYMVDEQTILDENAAGLRLLEVDNPLFVPAFSCIRFLITSVDVLHAWAVPSLGIKVDAVPGRLNQVYTMIKRPGEFYGQCSEICGVNHGFMPIKVVAFDEFEF